MKAAVIGAGKVGMSIAGKLSENSALSFILSRTLPASDNVYKDTASIGKFPRFVFIAVPDDAIAGVAGKISSLSAEKINSSIFLHTSGSRTVSVLSALEKAGAIIAAAHPYQTFAAPSPSLLTNIGWGTEAGDAVFDEVAGFIEKILNGVPVRLPYDNSEAKLRYHASAAAVSNLVTGAFAMSAELLGGMGIDPAPLINPIVGQALENALSGGMLTGPVARGDKGTLIKHLEAINDPAMKRLYCFYSAATAEYALSKSLISPASYEEFMRIIKKPLD